MFFFKTTSLSKLFYPIIILSLLTFSCSKDSSITGNSDQTNLSKSSGIGNINNPNDWDDDYEEHLRFLGFGHDGSDSGCLLANILASKVGSAYGVDYDDLSKYSQTQAGYNFRDKFLVNSKKGNNYIASYYILSEYGIENNLVMKHSFEHLSLMNTGIEVSRELQHGTNANKILINRSTYNDLNDIVKIYRDSENHLDIDVVLDYLETDLENYYNKTKAEIAADFE